MRQKVLPLVIAFSLITQSLSYGQVFQTKKEAKSFTKALLFSLALPGSGELYLNQKNYAYPLLASEATVWISALAFYTRADWLKENYKSYAVTYAGVNPTGKDDDFFQDIAFYPSRDQYNFEKFLYTEDPSLLYPETDNYNWNWKEDSNRLYYKELRNRSEVAKRNIGICLGIAAATRALSCINIIRLKIFNKKSEGFTLHFQANKINLVYSF